MERNFLHGGIRVIEGEDFLVIGTNRNYRVPEGMACDIVDMLCDVSAMKAELPRKMHRLPYGSVERLVAVSMAEKPLEVFSCMGKGRQRYGDILHEYGMPIEATELFYAFMPVMNAGAESAEPNAMGMLLSATEEMESQRFPGINPERAVASLNRVTEEIKRCGRGIETLEEFSRAYYLFHRMVLEYEIMQHELLDFRIRNSGRIGVLIKNPNAGPIAESLRGNLMETPPCWGVYRIGDMPMQTLEAVAFVESVLFP